MTMRYMGPFNGTMPIPSGIVQGMLRDVKKLPYLNYAQLVPAPEVLFSYWKIDPDEAVRITDLNANEWAYGSYAPTGQNRLRMEMLADRVDRKNFPWTIDYATARIWKKNGIDPKQLIDPVEMSRAKLHLALRAIAALTGASWGGNTATLAALLGTSGVYMDDSIGDQLTGAGNVDPRFLIIKRAFLAVKKYLHVANNGALTGEEFVAVIPPAVAVAISNSGEMFEAMKQQRDAGVLIDPNLETWGLPNSYGGFKLVVEDTVRANENPKAAGTAATIFSGKDFAFNTDTIYFVSRVGGLDGGYGFKNYSTLQIFTYNGEARVEMKDEPWHELMEGRIVTEDKVIAPATSSGFALTDVLST